MGFRCHLISTRPLLTPLFRTSTRRIVSTASPALSMAVMSSGSTGGGHCPISTCTGAYTDLQGNCTIMLTAAPALTTPARRKHMCASAGGAGVRRRRKLAADDSCNPTLLWTTLRICRHCMYTIQCVKCSCRKRSGETLWRWLPSCSALSARSEQSSAYSAWMPARDRSRPGIPGNRTGLRMSARWCLRENSPQIRPGLQILQPVPASLCGLYLRSCGGAARMPALPACQLCPPLPSALSSASTPKTVCDRRRYLLDSGLRLFVESLCQFVYEQ